MNPPIKSSLARPPPLCSAVMTAPEEPEAVMFPLPIVPAKVALPSTFRSCLVVPVAERFLMCVVKLAVPDPGTVIGIISSVPFPVLPVKTNCTSLYEAPVSSTNPVAFVLFKVPLLVIAPLEIVPMFVRFLLSFITVTLPILTPRRFKCANPDAVL